MNYFLKYCIWNGLTIPPIEIAKASLKVAELNYKNQSSSLRQWLSEQSVKQPADLFDTGTATIFTKGE